MSDPTQIQGYRIRHSLGSGGLAVVYLVDGKDGEPLALKRVGHPSETTRARTLREARIQSRLEHPNLVPVLDVLDEPDAVGLVMPYIQGSDLNVWLATHEVDLDERLALFTQACRGVAYAHANGVIHRDLKPSNILVDPSSGSPVARVTDFGIAKESTEDGAPITRTGAVMGTIRFMSPEQIRDSKRAGPASDVFALGAILYELVTSRPLVAGDDVIQIHGVLLAKKWVDPAQLAPRAPEGALAAIRGALEPHVADRIPDVPTLIEVLEGRRPWSAATGDSEHTWQPTWHPEAAPEAVAELPRRARVWPAVGGLVLGGLVALAVGWWLRPPGDPVVEPWALNTTRLTSRGEREVAPGAGPDGAVVYSRYVRDELQHDLVYRAPDGRERILTQTPDLTEFDAKIHPDGDRVLVPASGDGGREVSVLTLAGTRTRVLDRSARARWGPGGVGIWYPDGDRILEIPESGGDPRTVLEWPGMDRFAPLDSGVVAIQDDAGAWLVDPAGGRPPLMLDPEARELDVVPGADAVVTIEKNGVRPRVRRYELDLDRWRVSRIREGQGLPRLSEISARPDGLVGATQDVSNLVVEHDGEVDRTVFPQDPISCYDVTPDFHWAVWYTWSPSEGRSRVILEDLVNGTNRDAPGEYCATLSPDGSLVALYGRDRTVTLWEPATDTLRPVPVEWWDAASRFTPDGKGLLATIDPDDPHLVRIDVQTLEHEILAPGRWAWVVASADGSRLAGIPADGALAGHAVLIEEGGLRSVLDGPVDELMWFGDDSLGALVHSKSVPRVDVVDLEGELLRSEKLPVARDAAFWRVRYVNRHPSGRWWYLLMRYGGDVYALTE